MKDRNKKLKDRVEQCKKALAELGVKKPLDKFVRKFPKYSEGSTEEEKNKAKNRVRNLFYCKAFDEDFTKHLESFVEFTKSNY